MRFARLAALIPALAATAALAQTPASPGRVERLDPRIDALIPKDAKVELLASGVKWAEGPVWDKANGRLIFSDVPNNVAYQWTETGGMTVFLKPSGYTGPEGGGGREPGSNGLAFDARGRLTLTQCGDRRISRLVDGKFVAVIDRFEGKRFNSPNDLVWARDGSLYFTDPPYGLTKMFDDPGREIPWCGVYRVGPDGKVTVLVKDLRAPNGIGLSPDGQTLYVSQSDPDRPVVMAYALKSDGTIGAGRVFFDAKPLMKSGPGLPDGLKVDAAGNVWTSGPGGILILSPKGEHLGSIVTGVPTANLNFAPDGTVYMTANDTLRRIRTTAKGLAY